MKEDTYNAVIEDLDTEYDDLNKSLQRNNKLISNLNSEIQTLDDFDPYMSIPIFREKAKDLIKHIKVRRTNYSKEERNKLFKGLRNRSILYVEIHSIIGIFPIECCNGYNYFYYNMKHDVKAMYDDYVNIDRFSLDYN